MPDAATLNYYLDYFTGWLRAPAGTLRAIARIESGFDPASGNFANVCNSSGACGLMQMKNVALTDIKRVYDITVDPLNPIQAIVGAACFFIINYNYLVARNVQNLSWAALVVAYNGGWTAGREYAQSGNAPSAEGRAYVAKWASAVGLA